MHRLTGGWQPSRTIVGAWRYARVIMSGRIFSIGHGGRSLETLVAQLRRLEVSFLIDVRSSPYSRFQPEFSPP
jgi:hypothetical protein